ncbi:MAG: YjfB family protein [Ruminococcus sp.]|jgi:hypothetical protein|nr:YjfB family protein [Ruminococcus sp.]
MEAASPILMNSINISLLGKTMDTSKQLAAGVIKMADDVKPIPPNNSGIGSILDVKA